MAGVGIFALIFGMFFYLAMLLLPVALLVALQVWLCRKSVKLGMILPALSLALSLLLTVGIGLSSLLSIGGGNVIVRNEGTGEVVSHKSEVQMEVNMSPRVLIAAGVVFLVSNVPTVVFGGIWLHYKGRRDACEDLKRMRIEDLE